MRIQSWLLCAAAFASICIPVYGNPSSVEIKQNASRARALEIYRQSLSRTPEVLQNPAVKQWLGATLANPARTSGRYAGLMNGPISGRPAAVSSQTQLPANAFNRMQSGDYWAEMIQGGQQRWSDGHFPLKVYIATTGGAGFKPSFPSLFEQAAKQWSATSNNHLSFTMVGNPDGADITVEWLPRVAATECGDTVTRWAADASGNQWIHHATIKIGTWNSGPISDAEVAKCCLHELGHALGLKHSSNPSDIMYCQSNFSQVCALGPRDSATINKLYGLN